MALQLQTFAEQVLFGTSIDEKLSFPREPILDSKPGTPIKVPKHLPRPKHLKLQSKGVRARHPSQAKLVDERERGRLLHFFANHELLATELMALVLLKFPDAPKSFRQGVLETLQEEQIHTKLYIHRMEQCGITFGELPLSDYFWQSVSPMADPLDYVTRLSLTFEQANLDYARDYAQVFQKVGDTATARILNKIYQDEIEHVGFGLRWFRQWKARGKTDWVAYKESLVFPLSPARAKGSNFNAEGRRAVGFDNRFIENLEVFQQSRGRTPNVYWFNPRAEMDALTNGIPVGGNTQSPLEKDLEFLPAYLAKKDDILILRKRPSQKFLKSIQGAGITLPEIRTCATQSAPALDRKLNRLCPWAHTPESIRFFKQLIFSESNPQLDTIEWNSSLRALYSKEWSCQWARQWTAQHAAPWLAPEDVYGISVRSMDELLCYRDELNRKGYTTIACKAPFGTAAHGNRCIAGGEDIKKPMRQWLDAIWGEQETVIVEPWLNRVFDFSVQFESHEDKLRVKGFTRLQNNRRGQFQGVITNGFCKSLPAALVRFLMTKVENRPRVYRLYEYEILKELEGALRTKGFEGALGVDAFVYEDANGQLKLKPVVELNPRYTMGRVALELAKHTAAGSVGFFQVVTRSQLKKFGLNDFEALANKLCSAQPLNLTQEPSRRIACGSTPLTEPNTAQRFMALYHVRRVFSELPLSDSEYTMTS